jgi:hypothetical protein
LSLGAEPQSHPGDDAGVMWSPSKEFATSWVNAAMSVLEQLAGMRTVEELRPNRGLNALLAITGCMALGGLAILALAAHAMDDSK